jgi:chromosome segregation ATPase
MPRPDVQDLQSTYLPLLTRYDELKAKSTLTATKQEEVRKIIEKVGAQIPTAITQFDAYGKAMDISTEAGHNFIQQQVLINEQLNKDQLTTQRARYKELTTGIRETEAALAQLVRQQKISGDDYGALTKRPDFNAQDQQNYQASLKQTGEQVQALQSKLLNLKNTRVGVGGLIDQLKDIPPSLTNPAKRSAAWAISWLV